MFRKNETEPANVPEPGTIIGLFAVGSLSLGLKRKKQS
ncbi:MAG: PEP-CTERM sorting domain-containing protein [Crocosphaera sp.]